MGKGIKRLREVGMLECLHHVTPENPPEDYVPKNTSFNKVIKNVLVRGIPESVICSVVILFPRPWWILAKAVTDLGL